MIIGLQNQHWSSVEYSLREMMAESKFCGFVSFELSDVLNTFEIRYLVLRCNRDTTLILILLATI